MISITKANHIFKNPSDTIAVVKPPNLSTPSWSFVTPLPSAINKKKVCDMVLCWSEISNEPSPNLGIRISIFTAKQLSTRKGRNITTGCKPKRR